MSSLLSPSKQEEGGREVKYYGPPIAKGTRATPRTVDVPNGYYCGGPNAQEMWLGLDEVKAALNIPSNAVFFQSDNGVGFTYYYTEADLISWYHSLSYSLTHCHTHSLTHSLGTRRSLPRIVSG